MPDVWSSGSSSNAAEGRWARGSKSNTCGNVRHYLTYLFVLAFCAFVLGYYSTVTYDWIAPYPSIELPLTTNVHALAETTPGSLSVFQDDRELGSQAQKSTAASTPQQWPQQEVPSVAALSTVTPPEPVTSIHCPRSPLGHALVIGDWGGRGSAPYRTAISTAVGKAAGNIAQKLGASMVLSPGDDFYPHGVQTVDDHRFRSTFESQFSHPSLQIPWYFALGNHDYEGKIKPLIEYGKKSWRWNLPAKYYSQMFRFNITRTSFLSCQVLFVDTNRLVREFQRLPARDVEQWKWIAEQLERSTADWIFIVGHHPVYSIATRGTNPILVDELLPLMTKSGVAAYFAGHDHNLQHVHASGHSVEMFVIGAGSYITNSRVHERTVPKHYLKYTNTWVNKGGLASLSIGVCHSTITMYKIALGSAASSNVYTHRVANPRHRHVCCHPG